MEGLNHLFPCLTASVVPSAEGMRAAPGCSTVWLPPASVIPFGVILLQSPDLSVS